jgi:CubicO group peptidase (beta-lactamase class C family)
MNRFFIISIIALFAACSPTEQPKLQKFEYPAVIPQSLHISADRLVYIDRLLQEYVDEGILPHALTFVAKNGVVIHNKAFGWNDVESGKALKKDDIFRNYSQTKAITSVALMTLFEQGKFQIDDPVSKFIPECTNQVFERMNPDGS